MKKTILATSILSMISFGTFAQQVDVAKANQQTRIVIDTQMAEIDASVIAKLEAHNSSIAAVDGHLYEKDSQGGWAMVGATSAALFAGLVSGSSSNTSGSNNSDLPGNLPIIDATNPVVNAPDADNGRQIDQIADNMWQVSTHGEIDGYLSIENGTVYVRDSDYTLVTEWTPTLGHPIHNNPSNPIEATPDADNGRQVAKVGDNVWMMTTHEEVDGYIVDERQHNDGVKIYDENGTLINHITGDISADGGHIESTKGGEIHITVDRESGRIDGVYLNDVAQQTVDNIKSHIGLNPNFKKNLQQLKNRVMNARG
ncbi:hypothetical protein A1QO_14165 [Vibrio genomosp. F10 str. ZF-129]|uniref:Uncharacterized protein n=1 Tax=Vibrio genomosp. F10 str. ZF-129 TaxID=1187848 RepID=A0A1E5BB11_9VIBR|nr:hypothetical protein [Vibrio genomosp. F10]OEE31262.1 hypothetical protein A1QO_14165 [Vibrio genomosp. F10 str. ZF-129]